MAGIRIVDVRDDLLQKLKMFADVKFGGDISEALNYILKNFFENKPRRVYTRRRLLIIEEEIPR